MIKKKKNPRGGTGETHEGKNLKFKFVNGNHQQKGKNKEKKNGMQQIK